MMGGSYSDYSPPSRHRSDSSFSPKNHPPYIKCVDLSLANNVLVFIVIVYRLSALILVEHKLVSTPTYCFSCPSYVPHECPIRAHGFLSFLVHFLLDDSRGVSFLANTSLNGTIAFSLSLFVYACSLLCVSDRTRIIVVPCSKYKNIQAIP